MFDAALAESSLCRLTIRIDLIMAQEYAYVTGGASGLVSQAEFE